MKSKLLIKLLSLLGFSTVATSCEQIEEIGGGGAVCMYGCPSADYVMNVEVKEATGDTPIEGIRVSVIERYSHASTPDVVQADTLVSSLTDADGKALLTYGTFPRDEHEIVAEDIDGAENGGEFGTASVTITIESNDYKNPGENGWYKGTATKNVAIGLTKKE